MSLELLLVDSQTRRPSFPDGLDEGTWQDEPRPPRPPFQPGYLNDIGRDPNDLPAQRWGLVVPAGPRGVHLRELIETLVLHRAERQGAPVEVYEAPIGLSINASLEWKRHHFQRVALQPESLPRYLLILGDFDGVSLELQQVLSSDRYVGRLALPSDEAYRAYAQKVRCWETQSRAEATARFFSALDGTSATATGHHRLVIPMVDLCRQRQPKAGRRTEAVTDITPPQTVESKASLLRATREMEVGLLFTLSHGLGGSWRSSAEQRARQGELVLNAQENLTTEDVATRPFLPGGLWFIFACFGAGTPTRSVYHPWLSRLVAGGKAVFPPETLLTMLAREGEPPFVAALPQAALANPEGPLAVIGHVDVAWAYSYLDEHAHSYPARFASVVNQCLGGRRVGIGMDALGRYAAEANAELIQLYDQLEASPPAARDPQLMAQLWMSRHDLAGYILLGDPAVKFAIPFGR